MAENPFGQGGPEEEELPIEGNPIDTAEVPPALAEALASGEMTELEDGSVEVGQFAEEQMMSEQIPFDANLAEYVEEGVLGPISSDLLSAVESDIDAREDWEKIYEKGLNLLGVEEDERSEPFEGASGVTHPVLAESVTQFQAQAYKELLPSGGPVRVNIIGEPNPQSEQQAQRVQDYMNYQICYNMEEYDPELDQLLFYLPLSGSAFKKVYYDETKQRPVARFVPSEDIIVPYSSVDLANAVRLTHRLKMTGNEVRKLQVAGIYRDVPVRPTHVYSDLEETMEKVSGESATMTYEDDELEIYEIHTFLDLEGFEDVGQDGEPTGIKLPYIVTIAQANNKILSIRRNYQPTDPMKKKIQYFVQFKFLPGTGFYGFGLIHMIGGLTRTATAALRQLLDAGTLSNLPAGFKSRGIRVRDDAQPLQPGEFRDVDAPGGNIRDQFMPLPFKGPDSTLLQLMGVVVNAGQRFASIADAQVGDMNQNAAVGTTVALLERGSRVMSAIHKRLYVGLKQEFKLLSEVFKTYLPPVYPYDVPGARREVKVQDFDDRIDILPVADPNIFSQTQRISMAQTQLQLAQSNPQIHNLYQAYRSMYDALGVKNVNAILPPPQTPQPLDPSLEHILAMSGKPFQAFPGQDHKAHIDAHLNFMRLNMVQNNPLAMNGLQKNILEHISLMAQEQVQLEFVQEIQELQQLTQQLGPMMQNPQAMMQNPMMMQSQQRIQKITSDIEARKAKLIAEMTEDYAKEEEKIMGEYGGDPLLRLKGRELDLRAQENQRKKDEGQERLDLDKMKAMMNKEIQEDKLEQNQELAGLRAGVSLAKQQMADASKIHDFGRNFPKK